jgi:hypothetical protein
MSDYIPNPPDPRRDPRNYESYEPSGSKGLTLVVGILVAIALVAGLMFFTSPRDRTDQAQLPAQERTVTPPADQTRIPPIPPRPVEPPVANPAPVTPQK